MKERLLFSMLNHSCEEVLKRIFEHEGPLYLVEEGEKETLPFEEKMAEFMSVSMDILQEESIPLGIGLGAVLYLYMDAFSEEKKKAGGIEIPNEGTISSLLIGEKQYVKGRLGKFGMGSDFFCCGYVLSYYPSDESSGEDPCSME